MFELFSRRNLCLMLAIVFCLTFITGTAWSYIWDDCKNGTWVLEKMEGDDYNDGNIDEVASLFYDINGNMIKGERDDDNDGIIDSIATYTYIYYSNGKIIKEEVNDNDGTIGSVRTYTYDINGNMIKYEHDYGNDGTCDYARTQTYDSNGNIIKGEVDNDNDGIIDAAYTNTNTYDSNGNLIKEKHDDHYGTFDYVRTYSYDSNGNIIKREDDDDNDGTINRVTIYTYDSNGNKIKEESDSDNDGTIDSIYTDTYDSNGNIIKEEADYDNNGIIDKVSTYTWKNLSTGSGGDISLTIPAGATEGDGVLTGKGSVSVATAPLTDLTINLSSNDNSEATVPASITILSGLKSATFDITIIDDSDIDGAQTVIITASASGYSSATASVVVVDKESQNTNETEPKQPANNDYPYFDQCTSTVISDKCIDEWGFFYRQCTSFVAFRMNRDGGEGSFTNRMSGGHWGNAYNWDDNAKLLNIPVDNIPQIGAIAQWESGHVAYVESVNADGTVNISEYNYNSAFEYGERNNVIADNYIHVNDLNYADNNNDSDNITPAASEDSDNGGGGCFIGSMTHY